MNNFFYNLNDKLNAIRATPEVTHQQLNERDMGKHNNATTGFKALAKKAGGGEKGERIAGAQFQKMKKAGQLEEQDMDAQPTAAAKKKTWTPPAARTSTDEGVMDTVKSVGKKVAGGINRLVGHGSDEDMRRDVQRKAGVPQTGKKPAVAPMHPSDEYDYFTGRDKVRGGEQQVKEKMSPAKQKSFAALAPPKDKITFADKIAGAKKEVDEMLGQVAADAMRSAVGGGRGRNAEMDEERSKGTAFDMSTPRAATPKVGSVERGHKHDIKHTATGRMVTRRVDDQGNSVGADDASDTQAGPRGRGRPKGTKGAIGAKGPSGKSKLMTREGDNESSELKAAMMLLKKSGYKVTKAESTDTRDDHAEKAGKKVTKDIEYDEGHKGNDDNKAEKAGKKVTKDIEYDEKKKKKEKEVDESTTSGSVATSTATKGGGGSMVGKGIYDSMNFELEQMIAESMSINMSDSTEGGKSLTITATDEDALKLGMMLKNAGLGGGDAHGDDMHSPGEEPCETCGMPDCGCGDVEQAVDENAPDWPTNTETSDNALQYSGGLNKPKADIAGNGQSTVPVVATRPHNEDDDMRRMMEMAGLAQANLTPGKHTMQAMGPEMSYSDSDPEKIKYDNWLRKASDKDLWDEASKYESVPDYIGREFEKLVAQQKELLGPAAYREKGINDRLKSKLKKYPNMSAPMKEEEEVEEDFLESIQRMREIAGIKEAKKPDFLDMDKDGDKKEPMSKANKDKEEKKVDESIFALTNQWKAYKG